jgi:hypothetical protein
VYGIFANDSSGTTIARNVTSNDVADVDPTSPGTQLPEAGIYVGDSPHADATVWKNVSYGNLLGIFVRDAVPGGEAPPLSGAGIAVLGSDDTHLIDNGVFGNKPAEGFQSAFVGGIVVGADPDVSRPSNNVKVEVNTAFGNDPDLVWDEQGSGNSFFHNDCLTSQPDGLCEDPDDNGDRGHDGDHGDDHPQGDDHHGHREKHKHHKKHHRHDD